MSYKYLKTVGDTRSATGDQPSASAVYVNSIQDGNLKVDFTTCYDMFQQSIKKFSTKQCLGKRDGNGYKWLTYAETGAQVDKVAAALKYVGMDPQGKACNAMSLWCVPLYETLGDNAVDYIISHAEIGTVFVASTKLGSLIKALPDTPKFVKTVVYWGELSPKDEQLKSPGKGLAVYSISSFVELGAANPAPHVPPKPEDLSTLMYTSGTTGDPKGVMLTHAALVATVATIQHTTRLININFSVGDFYLSYLPLAHIFDRVTEDWWLSFGGGIGYWQGDVLKLMDDVQALRPAYFVGVPRVFDRVYSKAMAKVDSKCLTSFLFRLGKARKLGQMRSGKPVRKAAPMWNWLFKKFAAALGGRTKLIISGGAPLAPHVEEFLRVTMGCPVVQGYGLTESCAASLVAIPDVMSMCGTIGVPFNGVEVRLESVPEMQYNALDPEQPKGEVLLRTPQLFTGYFKNQVMTSEVMDKDGWFHTGDIATIQQDGAIRIFDRKKNIFKLSQGEYIAAEKIEASYKKNVLVDQIWVYGDSFKSCVVGVMVPNQERLAAWAAGAGVTGSFEEICANPATVKYVLGELTATGKAEGLKGFEFLRELYVEPKPFGIDEDLLTPTFKLKRAPLKKRYEAAIKVMYERAEAAEKAKEAAKDAGK